MTRLKLAALTFSGVGALVLGVGLGALFPRWLGPAAGLITFGNHLLLRCDRDQEVVVLLAHLQMDMSGSVWASEF